jgi:hypothetical protein
MPKVIARFKSAITKPRNISLFSATLLIIISRLYWLPGYSFSLRNWDDEIGWINDFGSMSSGDYLLYRDAPGYFVFVPRLIILLGEINPHIGPFSALRILVVAAQLLCFAAASSCVIQYRKNWKSWLLLFITLSFTYIEDLNYVHNLGYIFIFPIFFLVFRRINLGLPVKLYHVIFSIILVSKPFTALIVLFLVLLHYKKNEKARFYLLLLASYSVFYLSTYALLPHRWETPFNFDFLTVVKVLFDLPWILFSIIFPALSIGALGVFKVMDQIFLRDAFGITVYAVITIIAIKFRIKILNFLRELSLLSIGLTVVLVVNYGLVFSASDSFWIKFFPLFKLDSPQFLWARWSSVIPLVAVILIMSLDNVSIRARSSLLAFISTQWVILAILGQSWLSRYW